MPGDPPEGELTPLARRHRLRRQMQSLKSRRMQGLSRQSRRVWSRGRHDGMDPCGVLDVMQAVEKFMKAVTK